MVNVKKDSTQRLVFCMALALSAGLLWAADARAAVINGITWLEVDNTNTTVATGSIETNGFDGGGGDQTDNNWDYTTPFGVIGPGDTFEGTNGNGTGIMAKHADEDPGKLTVTLSGALDPGTPYTVFVAFRGASNQVGVEVSLDVTNWVQRTFNGADTDLDGTIDVAVGVVEQATRWRARQAGFLAMVTQASCLCGSTGRLEAMFRFFWGLAA